MTSRARRRQRRGTREDVRDGGAGARALQNELVIMGFTGGASFDGKRGNHCMLSPVYNVTDQKVENIVDVFVKSAEVLEANAL